MSPGRITPASAVGTAVALVLFGVGLGFGRADLALVGVVLVVAVGAALLSGSASDEADVRVDELAPDRGGSDAGTRVRIRVDAAGAETVRLAATALGFRSIPLTVAVPATVIVRLPLRHSGDQELIAVRAQAVGADGARLAPVGAVRSLRTTVVPRIVPVPFLPLPPRLGGRTGTHDSRRPGEGGEFRDIHPFVPGDRLRRIDWRATARLARAPGDLYVRRTLATADADVALVVDDRDDLTGRPGTWNAGDRSEDAPTSLDLAREAAWSLASAYLDAADQVSFHLLSHTSGDVPRGSGARQRRALRAAVTAVEGGAPIARVGIPRVPRGALVVLLSTLLDDDPVVLATRWRGAGHRVLLVDTLPRLRSERVRPEVVVAERIVLGEREERIRRLRIVGVDLLRWDGPPGERTAALRAMTRMRSRS